MKTTWISKASEVYEQETGKTIARTDIGGRDEQSDARATLIAAAPDMLEILEEVGKCGSYTDDQMKDLNVRLQEAIIKAKGL